MLSTPSMSNRGIGVEARPSESQREFLDLETDHRHLEHARRDVEVERRPPAGGGHEHHAGIRVHDHRMTDGGQHRSVVHAVGVRIALGEIHTVAISPLGDRCQLSRRPHERPVERAVVGPVGRDAVAGRHDVVEPQTVGERLDQVVWAGGGEHDRPTGGAMRWRTLPRQRVAPVAQLIGDAGGRCDDRRLWVVPWPG